MISGLRLSGAGLWSGLNKAALERWIALGLTIAAIASGIATYAVISGAPPYGQDVRRVVLLLNLDLVLLLLLGVVIARRLVQLWMARRQGSAGSKLQVRLVVLFSIVAVTPSILVSIFAVLFLQVGLAAWFSSRVNSALDTSLSVAQAYLGEHKEVIRADALAMAADLNREVPQLLSRPEALEQYVSAQAALRSLSEAVLFDSAGNVIARSGLSFTLEIESIPPDAIEQAASGDVVALTSDTDDRVRALIRLDGFGDLYLVVGRLVDPQVLAFMDSTQTTVSQYKQMEAERSSIQIASALIFAIVALLLLFAAVWVGLQLANHLAEPLSLLVVAADHVSAGDLTARVPETGEDDEIASLSRAFNRMTGQLASQRRALVDANEQLDSRRQFTEVVLAGVTAGVIGIDGDGRVALPNRAAAEFLGQTPDALVGKPLVDLIPELQPLLAKAAKRPEDTTQDHVEVSREDRRRTLLLRVSPRADGEPTGGYVVTFDDITELLSAQRQSAWAEIARRIAHEVKNPLTPIRLSAERLTRKYLPQIREDRESFSGSIETIVRQVDTIGRLIGEFSSFARMPEPVMRSEDMAQLVRQAVFLQMTARPAIAFTTELPDGPVALACDAQKVAQTLTNVLQNAIDAINERAGVGEGGKGAIRVRLSETLRYVDVEVEDDGIGLPADKRDRIFEPYVTTRAKGTGLGLAIVKKIMEEHGGSVELRDGRQAGTLARLRFPRHAQALAAAS